MKKDLGHKFGTKMELLLEAHLKRTFLHKPNTDVIIHHITDTKEKLQLEIERRHKDGKISFERVIIT